MVTKPIKETMDSVRPEDRWMGSTYSAHPVCCAVALKNIEILEREGLCENAEKMGARLHTELIAAFETIRTPATYGAARDSWQRWSLWRTPQRRRTLRATARSPRGCTGRW